MKTNNIEEMVEEFPKGKDNYCPRCYFEKDKVILRNECDCKKICKLADKGTLLAEFQKLRTDAIGVMFDNKDVNGIYPTGVFFATLDIWVVKALTKAKEQGAREERERIIKLVENLYIDPTIPKNSYNTRRAGWIKRTLDAVLKTLTPQE